MKKNCLVTKAASLSLALVLTSALAAPALAACDAYEMHSCGNLCHYADQVHNSIFGTARVSSARCSSTPNGFACKCVAYDDSIGSYANCEVPYACLYSFPVKTESGIVLSYDDVQDPETWSQILNCSLEVATSDPTSCYYTGE